MQGTEKTDDALKQAFIAWHDKLSTNLSFLISKGQELHTLSPEIRALRPICELIGITVLEHCQKHNEPVSSFLDNTRNIDDFCNALYLALSHQSWTEKSRWWMWSHLGVGTIISKPPKYREELINIDEVYEAANKYLMNPHWHNDYLDWIFMDAIVGFTYFSSYDAVNGFKYGAGYTLFEGKIWKAQIFNFFCTPLMIFIGWILPAMGLIKLSENYSVLAIIIAAIYYGWSFKMLFQWVTSRVSYWVRNKMSISAHIQTKLIAIGEIYDSLRGNIIHAPSLAKTVQKSIEKGAVLPAQFLCLMDRVKDNHTSAWFPHNAIAEAELKVWHTTKKP